MQDSTETTEGHDGTGVGGSWDSWRGNGDAAIDPRRGHTAFTRYVTAQARAMQAQADMAEAWVEMTREERMMCESPVWNRRDAV